MIKYTIIKYAAINYALINYALINYAFMNHAFVNCGVKIFTHPCSTIFIKPMFPFSMNLCSCLFSNMILSFAYVNYD